MQTKTKFVEVSRANAILKCKCPRCRQGTMFQYPLTRIDKLMETNTHCAYCGLHYEVEPGFFWGASYFNYGFSVALMVAIGIAINIFVDNPPIWLFLAFIMGGLLIFAPISVRMSRSLMLHLFGGIKYNPPVHD